MTPDSTEWKVLGPGNCQMVAVLLQALVGCVVCITHVRWRDVKATKRHLELTTIDQVAWNIDDHNTPCLYLHRAGSSQPCTYTANRQAQYCLEFSPEGVLERAHFMLRNGKIAVTGTFEILIAQERAA
ncbi:MAG TPA: hypothetical protein VLI05_04790 [Candidatus Saccharimonadia bacterium]|nr:hypothetical protein [Candidatus Saccharimonadia bacterium]